jgi:peptidoglycan/LPS O-acetylase OafA/YrhL
MRLSDCDTSLQAPQTAALAHAVERSLSTSSAISYKPQLDGLRAIAVTAVLIEHLAPKTYFSLFVFRLGYVGLLGVLLFFVLSGYLITGILLSTRGTDLRLALKRFYLRRTLRIFPIYFLTLAVLFAVGLPSVTEYFFWHAFYVSNLLFILQPQVAAPIAHLWSLSVEEQFYLVWPLLILSVPYKQLLRVILVAIAIGVGWKVWVIETLGYHLAGGLPVVSCMDSLAIGALLSYVERDEVLGLKKRKIFLGLLAAGSFIMLAQFLIWVTVGGRAFSQVTGYIGPSLIFAWFVGNAAAGFGGRFGAILDWAPLRYLGKISYGVYLYHFFMPGLIESLFQAVGIDQPGALIRGIAACGLSIFTAALSWHLIERPISQLKEKWTANKSC